MPKNELSEPENLKISIDEVSPVLLEKKDVSLSILRLDKVHPVVSGNKLFKLKYYIEDAVNSAHRMILTFGGAYSNHLAATAFAAKEAGLRVIACVRGEEGKTPSHTLDFCRALGTEIHFMNRELYRQISEHPDEEFLTQKFGEHITVPSGGLGIKGALGARDIIDFVPEDTYTHICTPVGSATTLAGLLLAKRKEEVMAFPAPKGMTDIPERLNSMGVENTERLTVISDYSFGGFGKWNMDLIGFMNRFYKVNGVPIDFVYTAKMLFGITDLISKDYFSANSKILAIHTGGLQGNASLPESFLDY